jgi:hypothetical protein
MNWSVFVVHGSTPELKNSLPFMSSLPSSLLNKFKWPKVAMTADVSIVVGPKDAGLLDDTGATTVVVVLVAVVVVFAGPVRSDLRAKSGCDGSSIKSTLRLSDSASTSSRQ